MCSRKLSTNTSTAKCATDPAFEADLHAWAKKTKNPIVEVEAGIHETMTSFPHGAPEIASAMEGFAGLARDARKMQVDNRQLVEGEVAQLEAKGAAVQRGLVVQAMALVPGALILSAIFTFLITRPIRQMDKAIRRLGDGDFSQSAQIVGPTDLEQLG